jgi:hypothetical protein
MAIDTNFNASPYYDDFDEDKKFLRVLFKPGFAVQARELTQAQTILQKQVERFGNHVFKNGSVVTGGSTFLQDATYIKLNTTFGGTDVVANNFIGTTIISSDDSKRAEVIKVYEADAGTGDPITLMVKQIYGEAFVSTEQIKTDEASPTFADISPSGVGTGQIFSVTEGVFYYEGFFIKNDQQTIATSKYSNNTANVRVGFEITESLVKTSSDTSLLDPAQDASNYQAPGADRFKIDLVLATRSIDSTDTTKFIELTQVENGNQTRSYRLPIYSVIEDTLARRTYDESGNYTVRPFNLSIQTNTSNTANMDVILSPGKAYIFGYEYETISPSVITVAKPRTTDAVQNKILSADYGNYVYTTGHFGTFPINSLTTVDLHCVPNASINLTSTASITNTKIGTARVKSFSFDSASNTSNSTTYSYKTFLFDVSVGSLTGTIRSANSGNVTIGNTASGHIFSSVTDAYKGAKLRITSGLGSGESSKVITAFDATNQVITLGSNFTTTPNSTSVWSIDFEFNDVESLATFSSTTRINSADIDTRSKDTASTFEDAYLADISFEPLVFPLGQDYITANTIADFSFSYRKLYAAQSFSANDSPALSVGSGESITAASTTSAKQENYQVVVTTVGTSPYTLGQTIPADKITTVNTTTRKLTIVDAGNMTANVIATIDFTLASGSPAKSKTLVNANSTVQTTGGESINTNGVIVFASNGQTTIQANNVIKTPGTSQSLYVPDVIELVSVYDYANTATSPTIANTGYTDITSRYTLSDGQKDSYYDHSSIVLKPGYSPPVGPLVVRYKAYSSSGSGFFSVDSYPTYATIPTNLRDTLDFRPVRKSATNALDSTTVTTTFDVDPTTTGPKIPEYGSNITLDYSYYLPRIDKVVLNKNRTFEVIKGIPSLTPNEPKNKDDAMNLYVLTEPAYLDDTQEVTARYVNNRRYTMRDIGAIEKRIENLEYYTSLSLLEQDAINKQDLTILDSTNLPRFKNGIVVDSFKGHSVADVSSIEYVASIDPRREELRPSFNISSRMLTFDSSNSSGYLQTGPFVTLAANNTTFVNQPLASTTLNINPFNVVNYLGKIELNPKSDIWVDTTKKADVLINTTGDKDAFDLTLAGASAAGFEYEWGDWETVWTGTSITDTALTDRRGRATDAIRIQDQGSDRRFGVIGNERTTTTTEVGQTRTGIKTTVSTESVIQSISDRVVDVSVIPYMRDKTVTFTATDFKPDTILYPFFDNTSVEQYVARANRIILASNNLQYSTKTANTETIRIFNNSTSSNNATATVVKTSNNSIFVVNVVPTSNLNLPNANVIGSVSATTVRIAGYEHYSGITNAATSTTITFALDASGANNEGYYANTSNSSTIFIVSGTGAGQQRTISSYVAATRTATISSAWSTTPGANSVYSIGRLTTTRSGDVAGVFNIPTSTFRTGEKSFRLIDSPIGDIPSSSSNGDASFFAQGLLETTETTIVSTTQQVIQRTSVTDTRVTSTTSVNDTPVMGWYDPLAQSFLVAPAQYPQGIYVDSIRVCFKTKHDTAPVTLQLRPTVNGYPSSTIVYPYGSVTLTPDKVKVTDLPSLDDATKYTEFVFDTPIYMLPGEHSFVLLSNSNGYNAYVAEIAQLDLVSGLQISEQPYGGSLFKSQNGSTWTADQNLDMLFRINRKVFNTSVATAQFLIDAPSSNVPFDLIKTITSEIAVANTSIDYSFLSEKSTGGLTGFIPFNSKEDYAMYDANGRRVLNATTGNTTFILKATMSTLNPDISPVLDITRFGTIFVDNNINSLPLVNSGILIANTGSAYANSNDVTITFTGGGGSGAAATANVVANAVVGISIISGGSGYTTSPTITITPGSGGGTNATATYNGEDKKTGGNAAARYITRRVTLADGFDSGDLRVYLTAYKPAGSAINVYYKLLSGSDSDVFDNKSYQLMTQLGNPNFVATNRNDFRELSFAPGASSAANNSIVYTSGSTAFNSFKTFAIKIVLSGTDTTDVPKVRDLRAIALPAGT